MPLSRALHLRPARRPVLERRSLIEIQDECQKAAYHKHDRDQNHSCLLQYRIEVIIAMRGIVQVKRPRVLTMRSNRIANASARLVFGSS